MTRRGRSVSIWTVAVDSYVGGLVKLHAATAATTAAANPMMNHR